MNALEKLYSIIEDVGRGRRTVTVQFTGSLNTHPWTGSMSVQRGVPVALVVHRLEGQQALTMLATSQLGEVWTTSQVPSAATPGTPSLETVLDALQTAILRSRYSGDELVARAQQLVVTLLGPNAAKGVQDAARIAPPDTEPKAFVDRCQTMIEPMLGRQQARSVLSALYR